MTVSVGNIFLGFLCVFIGVWAIITWLLTKHPWGKYVPIIVTISMLDVWVGLMVLDKAVV